MTVTKTDLDSYIEVEVQEGSIVVLERAGDGMTQDLIDLLVSYGLLLRVRVDTPCG